MSALDTVLAADIERASLLAEVRVRSGVGIHLSVCLCLCVRISLCSVICVLWVSLCGDGTIVGVCISHRVGPVCLASSSGWSTIMMFRLWLVNSIH